MPGLGWTSTVRTIFAPAAPLMSAGDGAMSACFDAAAPRNCRFGVPWAKATEDRSRKSAVVFTQIFYMTDVSRMAPVATRVLVVEDDPDIAELVARYLDKAGFSCEREVSGREALRKIAAKPPDVLVLDL